MLTKAKSQPVCFLCNLGFCNKSGGRVKKPVRGSKHCNKGAKARRTCVSCDHEDCLMTNGGQPVHLCTRKSNGCGCFERWHTRGVRIPGIDEDVDA